MTALLALGTLLAAGCAGGGTSTTSPTGQALTVRDAYVRATTGAMTGMAGMTGAFMVIDNPTSSEIRLTGGTSPVAGMVEIHQTVDGVMSKIPDGLAIPAGGSVTLKPGGNHVMLMDLTQPLKTGDEVSMTLKFSDGRTVQVTAPVKQVAEGGEPYASPTTS